jgi:hypothetical protein
MRRPEQYQLAFEFARFTDSPPSLYASAPGTLSGLDSRETGISRFVRRVADEVVVRSPAQAAHYLLNRVYVPFERFDQEEVWACAV